MPHKGLAGAHYHYLRPNVRRQHGYSKVSESGNLDLDYPTKPRNAHNTRHSRESGNLDLHYPTNPRTANRR